MYQDTYNLHCNTILACIQSEFPITCFHHTASVVKSRDVSSRLISCHSDHWIWKEGLHLVLMLVSFYGLFCLSCCSNVSIFLQFSLNLTEHQATYNHDYWFLLQNTCMLGIRYINIQNIYDRSFRSSS